ncbi:MAG: glycosyltransferase [Thalassotalea sp.]|nr:glycosyltransferase [Thalassotalea sp.]
MKKRVMVYDPVPFFGGSKQVAKQLVKQLLPTAHVVVVTNDRETWQDSGAELLHLSTPESLKGQTQGLNFYLKHLWFALQLLCISVFYGRFKRVLGISGPTVDFALYIYRLILPFSIFDLVQLVQGPVPMSRIAGYGIKQADAVFCLETMVDSTKRALAFYQQIPLEQLNEPDSSISQGKVQTFTNGIELDAVSKCPTYGANGLLENYSVENHSNENSNPTKKVNHEKKLRESKPSRSRTNFKDSAKVSLFWCASLLNWKRLDLFLAAVSRASRLVGKPVSANICYILPKDSQHVYWLPGPMPRNIKFYQQPENLDEIRASSSIFISSSENEPFGLSVLESMAAGLTVVIPHDDAYWDKELEEGKDCFKYTAGDENSLAHALAQLVKDAELRMCIGKAGQEHAQHYSAKTCYQQICKALT